MKKFTVTINAYDHYAKFEVLSEDNSVSLEQAIVDKLGQNDIKWEHLGEMHDPRVKRITYEEVIDGQASSRSLHQEEGSGSRMGTGSS